VNEALRALDEQATLTHARITELRNEHRRASRRRDLAQQKVDRLQALLGELEQAQELRRLRMYELQLEQAPR